jgi:integrase
MADNASMGLSPLLSDFVQERYLPFVQENKRSWKTDKSNLERHILPHLGSYRLSDISADILKSWVSALELTGLSYSSCFRLFWLAKYVLNCAVRWGALASDAAFKAANLPAMPHRQPVLLGAEDILRLIDILKTYHHRAAASAIHLMLLTGASKSEILFARWEDVDFERGTLVTDKTFTGPRISSP